ncbi:S-adenosyl-L-methionine-dependent methyltransferase [Neohortaea acidophila]|uniref:S-adenosyl-L-methionine-dependent methyltransferase n=1 Tax=Neohortaea acidophila TaxID=245834 RepID=A0A6A6PI42_9PEZI|nr:S-adenosyl-L-methionine-dependent methyltransferase [Neohortaea acidophila]KAF2479679.1 S-adenosyl-L-methionine-dependent methyltransferase [Neohortaea acidophila]
MTTFTEANKEHFNNAAATYDEKPWMKDLSAQIGTALLERKDWAGVRWHEPGEIGGREVKLLDYACGTGSVTKAYGPLVTKVIGVDISPNMVQLYNQEAASAGLQPEQVRAVAGDLFADEVPAELNTAEFYNFDVIVVGLGFHHFENPVLAIQRLSERLKAGRGVLMIIDFLPFENEAEDGANGTIKHAGFQRSNLLRLHDLAKLEKFSFSVVDEEAVMQLQHGTRKRKMFVTKALAPPTAWGKFSNWLTQYQITASEQMRIEPKRPVPQQLGFTGQTNVAQSDTWHREFNDKFK